MIKQSKLKMNIHMTASSRMTDGGRLYFKKLTVFMWLRKPGRRDITTHSFYLESWPEVRYVSEERS